jgi:hypothetical protein
MKRVLPWLVGLACGFASCGDDDVNCPLDALPAIRVTIVDSLTNEPLASMATAIATEGTYVDTLQPCHYDSLGQEIGKCGAYERAGTYSVRVIVSGYGEWSRTGIRVNDLECGVATASLEARLMPDSL